MKINEGRKCVLTTLSRNAKAAAIATSKGNVFKCLAYLRGVQE